MSEPVIVKTITIIFDPELWARIEKYSGDVTDLHDLDERSHAINYFIRRGLEVCETERAVAGELF